jgi:hypothetical protein
MEAQPHIGDVLWSCRSGPISRGRLTTRSPAGANHCRLAANVGSGRFSVCHLQVSCWTWDKRDSVAAALSFPPHHRLATPSPTRHLHNGSLQTTQLTSGFMHPVLPLAATAQVSTRRQQITVSWTVIRVVSLRHSLSMCFTAAKSRLSIR